MIERKHKTWAERLEIAKRKIYGDAKASDDDIFDHKTSDDFDIFARKTKSETEKVDTISWVDLVKFFYTIKQQVPDAENCEVEITKTNQGLFSIIMFFKDQFDEILDIEVNDGNSLVTYRLDPRLSQILGSRNQVLFKI